MLLRRSTMESCHTIFGPFFPSTILSFFFFSGFLLLLLLSIRSDGSQQEEEKELSSSSQEAHQQHQQRRRPRARACRQRRRPQQDWQYKTRRGSMSRAFVTSQKSNCILLQKWMFICNCRELNRIDSVCVTTRYPVYVLTYDSSQVKKRPFGNQSLLPFEWCSQKAFHLQMIILLTQTKTVLFFSLNVQLICFLQKTATTS